MKSEITRYGKGDMQRKNEKRGNTSKPAHCKEQWCGVGIHTHKYREEEKGKKRDQDANIKNRD